MRMRRITAAVPVAAHSAEAARQYDCQVAGCGREGRSENVQIYYAFCTSWHYYESWGLRFRVLGFAPAKTSNPYLGTGAKRIVYFLCTCVRLSDLPWGSLMYAPPHSLLDVTQEYPLDANVVAVA